jgi:transcriptional regulator with XRE-family HTH domain
MTSGEESEQAPVVRKRGKRQRLASVDGPEPMDIHVGARIRLRRTLMGLSQSELAAALRLTFQQIQNEHASNRVSASVLYRLAEALDVPVSFFFDDFSEGAKAHPAMSPEAGGMGRESLELLRNYYGMNGDIRRRIYDLVKMLKRQNEAE